MFNQYPYLNINDLNLDYLLKSIKEMRYEVTNFVSLNAIKYADPIQWDITRQYEKNTIVIDPLTGVAYISVQPVPRGVALTRDEYWTVVFDLGRFVARAAQNFTEHYEPDTTLISSFHLNVGDWLVWGDVLYKAIAEINVGDYYVVNTNIEHFTIEDLYNAYLNTIASILAIIGNLTDLTTSDTTSVVNAINSVVSDFNTLIGDLNDLNTTDKSSVVNAINEVYDDSLDNFVYNTIDDCGIVNDGTTDNASAFAALTDNVGLKAGIYLIDSNCTINCQLVFAEGAKLYISSGVSVTINGQILAGRYQIFDGDISNLIVNNNDIGVPEWFDRSVDDTIAIQKCVDLFPVTSLAQKAYLVSSPINIRTGNRELAGVNGDHWGEDTNTWPTRILATFGNNHILIVAPDAGYSPLTQVNNTYIHDILFARTVAPVGPADSGTATGCAGVFITTAAHTYVRRCRVADSIMGYMFTHAQRTKFEDCAAFRGEPASGDTTNDKFYGFYLHGDINNATAYLINCTVYMNEFGSNNTIGFYAVGYTNDLVIDKFEVFGLHYGVMLYGTNLTAGANVDIHIINCILDQIRTSAITFDNFDANACVEVGGNYIGMHNDSLSGFGFDFTNCKASMTIHDNQYIGITNIHVYPARISHCQGVSLKGNLWSDVQNPVWLSYCNSCNFSDVIHSKDTTCHIPLSIDNCTNCYFNPVMTGDISSGVNFDFGYYTDNVSNCEFNMTGLDANKITNMMNLNGTLIHAPATVGTNLVSGVF